MNRVRILDAPFRVPFLRNAGFVGREDDLERLHALLQKGGAVGVRPAALTGMGGIGKTQLAVEYVYACHSAAAFTRAFLRTRPIEPRASAPPR